MQTGLVSLDKKISDLSGQIKNLSEQKKSETTKDDVIGNVTAYHYDGKFGYVGTLTVKGYPEIKRMVCEEGEPFCSKTVDYVYFKITDSANQDIFKFINATKGNTFITENGVGIGCYEKEKNRIYSYTAKGEVVDDRVIVGSGKRIESIISSDYILSATKSNPVDLTLTAFLVPDSEATECFSYFKVEMSK